MKKLALLLALCLLVTAFASCAKKPVEIFDETPKPDTAGNDTDNTDNTEDTDTDDGDTSNPELDFDDVPVPVKKGIECRVIESSLNVRETPGTKGKSLGTVKKGDDLLISKIQGVDSVLWGYNGEGYVCLDYVAFDKDRNGIMVLGTVSADNLSAREAPHTFCEILEKIPKGTRLEISGFACFGTAVWGLSDYGWVSLDYVTLDQGVEIVEGENAETLDPFFMAPDYKEVTPKSEESIAPTLESITGTWEFVTLTSFYSTIFEEYFTAVGGYLTLNEDGSFVCGYADYTSTLYSQDASVKSWDVTGEGYAELGGTFEIVEGALVLSYTYYKDTVGDEVVTEMSKTVTLRVTQDAETLFVKNPQDIIYSTEKDAAKITHSAFYRNVSGSLLEKVYPGTYY